MDEREYQGRERNGRKDEDRREVSRDCEVKLINKTVDKMAVLRPA